MTDLTAILTKIYGKINQIKVSLSLNDTQRVWKQINELNDYLISLDIPTPTPPPLTYECDVTDKNGNHCSRNPIHKIKIDGYTLYLCSECYLAVKAGAYGIELRNQIIEQEGG